MVTTPIAVFTVNIEHGDHTNTCLQVTFKHGHIPLKAVFTVIFQQEEGTPIAVLDSDLLNMLTLPRSVFTVYSDL